MRLPNGLQPRAAASYRANFNLKGSTSNPKMRLCETAWAKMTMILWKWNEHLGQMSAKPFLPTQLAFKVGPLMYVPFPRDS